MQWILILVLTFADGSDEMHVAIAMDSEELCRQVEDNFVWAAQYKDVLKQAMPTARPMDIEEARCMVEQL